MGGGGEKAVYLEVDSFASHHTTRNGWVALRLLHVRLGTWVWYPLGSLSGSLKTLLWRPVSTISTLLLPYCLSRVSWGVCVYFISFWSSALPPWATPLWRGPIPSGITFSLCANLERKSRASTEINKCYTTESQPQPTAFLHSSLSWLVNLQFLRAFFSVNDWVSRTFTPCSEWFLLLEISLWIRSWNLQRLQQ